MCESRSAAREIPKARGEATKKVSEAEGYNVYFRENNAGSWVEVGSQAFVFCPKNEELSR